MPDARPRPPAGTFAWLRDHRFTLFGSCDDCAALYRKDLPASERVPAFFDIDLEKLIAERGAGASYIRMAPVPCPRCGSRRTQYRLSPPPYQP
jgi:hypothetical protein